MKKAKHYCIYYYDFHDGGGWWRFSNYRYDSLEEAEQHARELQDECDDIIVFVSNVQAKSADDDLEYYFYKWYEENIHWVRFMAEWAKNILPFELNLNMHIDVLGGITK